MPKAHTPRSGSMQYWPRKRAKKAIARVRSWPAGNDAKPLGFAGYKAGMTHALVIDNNPNSKIKGKEIFKPLTIIECPPIKILSVRFYKSYKNPKKLLLKTEILNTKLDKELSKKITFKKSENKSIDSVKPEEYDEIRLLVYTQPKLTGIGKKKPEVFELGLGGKKEEQLNFVKSKLDSDIKIEEVFSEGEQVDAHAISTGKGFKGAVQRFGIAMKSHKTEKTRRTPGSLGGWISQAHVMYRVPHAGQTGYHQRVQLNSRLIKIGADPKEININGGIINYGVLKNSYLLVEGSLPGPKKRLITLTAAQWSKKITKDAPTISYLSTASKQGK